MSNNQLSFLASQLRAAHEQRIPARIPAMSFADWKRLSELLTD